MLDLKGRVVIVTGAGGGLGREHALFLAAHGASVVVNDIGVSLDGMPHHGGAAERTVNEIVSHGGQAVASTHDVSDWSASEKLVQFAVDSFGALHVLVNNAGIVRDRSLTNMSEQEWDDVVRVNLKGHVAPTRHALSYWRQCAKAGSQVAASVIHTSSVSGLIGNFGQANYGAAKMAIVALSRIVSLEASRFGVRSNVIAPDARTRMSLAVPEDLQPPGLHPPQDEVTFDYFHPANVSPLIGWLALADCPADSQVFYVAGNTVQVLGVTSVGARVESSKGRWTLAALQEALPSLLASPATMEQLLEGG